MDASLTPQRRAVLGAIGAGATALTGGCLRRVRTLAGWRSPDQVQLRIKTLPADADPYALHLARTVAGWYRTAGIDAGVVPMSEQELMRETLLRNDFELFLMRLPSRFRDPDALRTLLHSQFADAPGWQNPFGYTDLDVDEWLEAQRRRSGSPRQEVVEKVQTTIAETQPFTLLTVPDDIRAARTTSYSNWGSAALNSPLGYLALERTAGTDARDGTLRVVATDSRATTNLNPLSVEFRRNGVLTGFLYDSLGSMVGGETVPWLAASWAFVEESPPVARVTLREGATWHDGTPLTATDVAFTYDLLKDTTLDTEREDDTASIPSPRYSGRSGLVEDVRVPDDSEAVVEFADADPSVAVRAFTVPILPKHVWADRTEIASIGGVEIGPVTEALVTNNMPPVGSGPLQFVRNTPRERLVLERVDDHFLNSPGTAPSSGLSDWVGPVPFKELSLTVVGSDVTGVELVGSGEADVTGTPVTADTVPRIGREADLDLVVSQSATPYIMGYNTRQPHLNNPRFRHTLARLIDGNHLTDAVLDGYGRPAVGPLWGTEWYPTELELADRDPVTPFLGSDGEVDAEHTRSTFREIGYRYDDGQLIGRGG